MNRVFRMTVEYYGAAFSGFQVQPNVRTVQGVIEEALEVLFKKKLRIVGAGRTDAGVHAMGQVVSVPLESHWAAERIARSLNGIMPRDVVVVSARWEQPDFHARFSATARVYRYLISTKPTALNRNRAWVVIRELDRDLMEKCAEEVMGTHDFQSFCRANSRDDAVCTVSRSLWRHSWGLHEYSVEANRFVHTMVRSLVGSMVAVSRGKASFDEFRSALHDGVKRPGKTAPAHGLVLARVRY